MTYESFISEFLNTLFKTKIETPTAFIFPFKILPPPSPRKKENRKKKEKKRNKEEKEKIAEIKGFSLLREKSKLEKLLLPEKDKKIFSELEKIKKYSPDNSTKVAAAITDKKRRKLGIGYNKIPFFPSSPSPSLKGVKEIFYYPRKTKYKNINHAELNALASLFRKRKKIPKNPLLFTSDIPCNFCLRTVANFNLKTIYSPIPKKFKNKIENFLENGKYKRWGVKETFLGAAFLGVTLILYKE